MQSDQLHVPAIGTVDFCFSMTLFAVRSLTFHPVWSGFSLTPPQGIDYFNILKFQFRVSNYSQQCVDCSKAYSDVGLSKKWGYLDIVRNNPASEFALEMHGNYGFNMMF